MKKQQYSPYIVGIGGTTRAGSATEKALGLALAQAERQGARVKLFGGEQLLALPHYLSRGYKDCRTGKEIVEAIREADGLVIASPGYHGSISGLVKNAIDYIEETAKDERAYLDGLPVGLIVTAWGWQATGSTMAALRSIVHALRGWPTPLGAAINTSQCSFEGEACSDQGVIGQLNMIGSQVHAQAALRLQAHN